MKRAIQILCMAVVAGFVFVVSPAGAQEIYQWDAQSGTGGAVEDGGGAWQVGVGNWRNQTTLANDAPWADGNDAVFGGGAGGAAGTVTVSGAVVARYLTFNDPFAGEYTLSGGTISAEQLIKNGSGTATLSGAASIGNGVNRDEGWRVHGGKLVIDGNVTVADRNNGELTTNDAALEITGVFTSGGHDQILRGTTTLSGNGRWNLRGDGVFTVANGENENATLNIQDSAVLDVDRSAGATGTTNWSPGSLVVCMGWGPCTGAVNQDGGTVNVTSPVVPWGNSGGPGLVMGGYVNRPGEAKEETYNLNGGVLNASGIFNMYMEDVDPSPVRERLALVDPALGGHTAIFNFNGGLLRASQDDSTDPQVISEGTDHLMGNLSHAYVRAGGARIDTNSFNASINQALEHDPALGGAPDGGLQKLGDGVLTLLLAGSYTGDTTVNAGVLEIMDAYLDDASSVSVLSGAIMDLNFTGADTIAGLTLGGIAQGPGLYNIGSDPAYFTGTGSLEVIPEPATLSLLMFGWLAIARRRRS